VEGEVGGGGGRQGFGAEVVGAGGGAGGGGKREDGEGGVAEEAACEDDVSARVPGAPVLLSERLNSLLLLSFRTHSTLARILSLAATSQALG
jgi:hypothetical protein